MTTIRRDRPGLARSLLLATFLAATGCDYPLGFGHAWVDGEWIYQAQSPSGAASTCEINGLVLALDQEGEEFSGVVEGGELLCESPTDTLARSLDGAPITNGEIRGRQVVFSIGAGLLEHRGLVEGRSMSGTFTSGGALGDLGVAGVEGQFAAARPPRQNGSAE